MKHHIDYIKEQARALLVATVATWFTNLKYKVLSPFLGLPDKILGRLLGFIKDHQARKAVKARQLFFGTKLAVEDCVVLYPSKRLRVDALKFFATRELSTDLRSALKDYFKTHTDPNKFGDIMEEAYLKGASPPPDYPVHTGDIVVNSSALATIPVPHNVRSALSQEKAKDNQLMWNFKKKHGGLSPREYKIESLKGSIEHIEKVISGELKRSVLRDREQYAIDHIEESKAKLKVLQASKEYAPDNPWGSVSGSIDWAGKLKELDITISHLKFTVKNEQERIDRWAAMGRDAYELVKDNNELEKHITKLIIARNELKKELNATT